MDRLSQMLDNAEGRKVYGYLKKPVKAQVDAIVDELAKLPEVAACYEEWNRIRDEVSGTTRAYPGSTSPSPGRRSFVPSRTWVVREAEDLRLGVFTFEDEDRTEKMDGEQEAALREEDSRRSSGKSTGTPGKSCHGGTAQKPKKQNVQALEQLWKMASRRLLTSWESAGGTGWECSRTMNRRNCGFAGVPKPDVSFLSTLWAGCWKRRSGWWKQSPGTKKQQLRGIRLPLIGWENCIFRESWFPKMCRKRWSI